MRKKLIAKLGILGLAAIFLLSMASYSTDQQKDKGGKGKPGKPDTGWIEFFDGDLIGGQEVIDCCPNAGPWPEYRMMLTFAVPDEHGNPGFSSGIYYDGQLFISGYGAGRNRKYIVQFWNEEMRTGIEIIGGVPDGDKKDKISTWTFTNDKCYQLFSESYIRDVSFILVRYTIRE